MNEVLLPAANAEGINPYRGDDISSPGKIMTQVCESIIADDLIFVYLDGHNPNVYYELAIAHMLAKPTILIKSPEETIPFDIHGARLVALDWSHIPETIARIRSHIRAILDTRVRATRSLDVTSEDILCSLVPDGTWFFEPEFSIAGRWTGFTDQDDTAPLHLSKSRYNLEMRVKVIQKRVIGNLTIMYGDDFDRPNRNSAIFLVHGSYRSPRHVRLHYDNDLEGGHYGSLMLEFKDNGNNIDGLFVGRGIASGSLVSGSITMRRASSSARDKIEEAGRMRQG